MTSVSYEDIFSFFLGNVTDYNIASLDISDANELMVEYLHKAVSEPYIRRLFSSITLDDVVQKINFEMKYAIDEEDDLYFVMNILSKEMVVEWLKPLVRKTTLINQHITSSKESKFYSQATHLTSLRGLLEDVVVDVRKTIRDRGYVNNAYLGDI